MPPLSPRFKSQQPFPSSDNLEDTESVKPSPVLRLHLDELSHPATSTFLSLIDSSQLLPNAISHIINHLYTPLRASSEASCVHMHIPPTRSVTLVLRSMDGVAYTTGLPLDSLHKEIHLSLTYASRFVTTPHRFRDELVGVVTHEMVHAYQWDAEGTCPGGLIEGIADYVRLKAGLAPPHWKRNESMERWDEGYQRTAYFLEFLEGEYGTGTVARINANLRRGKYEAASFWTGIFGKGRDVDWLFKKYRDSLKGKAEVEEETQALADDGVLVELEDAETLLAGPKSLPQTIELRKAP